MIPCILPCNSSSPTAPPSLRLPVGIFFALSLALVLAGSGPAFAQGESGNVCVRDYRGGAVCTANDVRIEALNVVSVNETCIGGTPGETEVVFEALVSSAGSPNRYDIGLFLALDGGSARDGDSCYHDFLSGPLTATPTYGDKNSDTIDDIDGGPWWNGATDGDSCGDIESNTQVFTELPPLRFACIDNNGDGSADVSVCTSWDNNTGTACNTVVDAFPGTNSKCSCGEVELGIPPAPEITIVKSPSSQSVTSGGTASFTFTVTSKTTVSNVVVSDPDCDAAPTFDGGDTNTDSILTPDETWTYSCSKSGVVADFTNTVTVGGDGPLGAVSDTDSADVTVVNPSLSLTKTGTLDAGGDGVADAGDTIDYSFEVENTGNVTLNNVAVTDPLPGLSAITCPGGNPIPTLAIGATETCTATYTLLQADVDAGQVDNTATASGTDPDDNPVEDTGTTTTVVAGNPALAITKTGVVADGGDGVADVGDSIDYSFEVENAGNVTLTNISVSDPLVGTVTCPSGNPIPSLAPGASETCTGTYALVQADVDAGQVENTATADSDQTPPDEDTLLTFLPPFTAEPDVAATKASSFDVGTQDNDGSGTLTAGDELTYTLVLTNSGSGEATAVVLDDTPDANTSLVVGSVTTTRGTVVLGNTAGDTDVQVDVGILAAGGGSATVVFRVLVDDPLPAGVTELLNQGVVSGDNFTSIVTDDPNTAPSDDPTSDPLGPGPADPVDIPTLSEWALLLLGMILGAAAFRRMQERGLHPV